MAKSRNNSGSNAALIREVLQQEGFSDRAIRASLARMKQESNFNPKAINKNDAGPGKHSRGIFQWNRERLGALMNFASSSGVDWQDVRTQARFFAREAKTTEKKWGSRLLNAQTDEDAAKAAISMARPQGWKSSNPTLGHGYQNTLNWTKNPAAAGVGPSTLYARQEKAGQPFPTSLEGIFETVNSVASTPEGQTLPPEPEQFGPALPDGFFDYADGGGIEPIDNSPGKVFGQTALGLLSGVSAAISSSQEESAGPRLGSQMKELSRAAPSPLSVGQIRSMIRV